MDDGQTVGQVLDAGNTGKRVLADRGYDSQANRELLQLNELRDGIARRAKPAQERRQRLDARNRTISRTRVRGEHVLAGLQQLGGKVVPGRDPGTQRIGRRAQVRGLRRQTAGLADRQ